MSAVPICATGSPTMPNGSSHMTPPFKAYHQRKKQQSPGKGAGQRALIAVSDKIIRIIYRLLTDQTTYSPNKDQSIAQYYAAKQKVA